MKHVLAKSASINLQDGFLAIDGVVLPWWLAAVEPEINADIEMGIVELGISFLVEGSVLLTNPAGHQKVIDPVLGDVTEWAQRYVRKQLQAAYSDLRLP